MPTTWDESVCIDSSYGEYYTMARRSGEEWFLGSASAMDRTFTFQPSYLEDGVKYLAEIYTNSADDTIENNKIQIKKYIIDSSTSIDFNIMAAGGVSIRMVPEEEIAEIPQFDPVRFELESLAESIAALNMEDYTDASVRNSAILQTLEEANALIVRADATTEEMQEMIGRLESGQAMLVLRTKLLNPVDLSNAVITADNERDGEMCVKSAIDGDVNTKWHTQANTNPPYNLTLDLGSEQRISRIEILGRNDHVNGYPLVFEVLVSDDGENFEKIMDVDWTGVSVSYGCLYGFDLPEGVNTRYLRLHFTDSYISASPYKPVSIAELYLYATPFGELDDLIREAETVLELLDDEAAKAALQEAIWAAVDYEQTAQSEDGLEEQIQSLTEAIETARPSIKAYTVRYDLNGGTGEISEKKTTFEGSGLIPEEVPSRTGYVFDGWTADGIEVTEETKYSDLVADESVMEITLQARWKAVELPYVDVDPNGYYYEAVRSLYEKGIMTGMDETHFEPGTELARAQLVTILYRMAGSPEVDGKPSFPDVAEGDWYSDAVVWAAEKGIVTGYSNNGNFGPADPVTREQLATMLYRYNGAVGIAARSTVLDYPDAMQISAFARDAMTWAVQEGIITGQNNGTILAPQNIACRAEVATMIARYLE